MISDKKQELIEACSAYVGERIDRIQKSISDLEDALKSEAKSSAGDKYETGRAMLHLEFEKLSGQLEQYGQLKKTITLISNEPSTGVVAFGSVVETSGVNYIIAIPAGKFEIGEETYYAVGAISPVAKALMGKKKGDEFNFNGSNEMVTGVF